MHFLRTCWALKYCSFCEICEDNAIASTTRKSDASINIKCECFLLQGRGKPSGWGRKGRGQIPLWPLFYRKGRPRGPPGDRSDTELTLPSRCGAPMSQQHAPSPLEFLKCSGVNIGLVTICAVGIWGSVMEPSGNRVNPASRYEENSLCSTTTKYLCWSWMWSSQKLSFLLSSSTPTILFTPP